MSIGIENVSQYFWYIFSLFLHEGIVAKFLVIKIRFTEIKIGLICNRIYFCEDKFGLN